MTRRVRSGNGLDDQIVLIDVRVSKESDSAFFALAISQDEIMYDSKKQQMALLSMAIPDDIHDFFKNPASAGRTPLIKL